MKDQTRAELEQHLTDPEKAAVYLERLRWPGGAVCPHCGGGGRRAHLLPHDPGKRRIWKCGGCREQFSVTVGTIFEGSHIKLHKWLYAFHLLCGASKKGISALQLARRLQITYKSAWFMVHRIRYALAGTVHDPLTGIVEVNKAYVRGRGKGGGVRGRGSRSKTPVVALVQWDGPVRVIHIERHGLVHTDIVERFFAILRRGVTGTFHSASKTHLHRYLSGFEIRYNTRKSTDGENTVSALGRIKGKRLRYRDSSS